MAGNKGIVSAQFYTFSAANQTITFSNDYAGLDLGEITYITNIKNGVATVIYDPFDATKGGTLNGLTLTLAYNTTGMADTDPLQIITGFTPLNADPLPVTIVEGPDQKDDTDLLNRIADNLDFLNLALDQAEGIEVNVREKNAPKRDVNNAQVASDAVQYNFILSALNASAIVDTTGYNSVAFYCFGLTNASLNIITEHSEDLSEWSNILSVLDNASTSVNNAGSSVPITAGSSRRLYVPVTSRYVRVRINSYISGGTRVIATLRQMPIPIAPFASLPVTANITLYNGTTVATAQQTDAAGNLASAGNFAIGSSYVGTTNRPNAASVLATGVPYPISIGGREQPYIGALAGVFRHITVDGGGRYILGGDTPDTETRTLSKLASGAIPGIPPRGVGGIPNSMQGSQALTITDVAQDFGDTQVSLLRQILTELKILNQNFAEMPEMLNQPSYELSEPQEYRDNGAFDSSIQ